MLSSMRILALSVLCSSVLLACGRHEPAADPGTVPASTPSPNPPPRDAEIHAVFTQRSGTIRVRLAIREAPRTCLSFINLVERDYFDGRPWDEFSPVVRQCGETYSMYTLPHEFTPRLLFNRPGLLCVSNTTNDATARAKPTRIFFTVKEQDRWNLVYAPFGEITDGLVVAKSLVEGETIEDIVIEADPEALRVLRSRFAGDLAEWNRLIDARINSG